MACSILDFQCIFVNELVGSTILAVVIAAIMYFIIAGKLKFGFDTTLALLVPIIIIGSLMITGFSIIYAVITFFIAILISWVFQEIIRNR